MRIVTCINKRCAAVLTASALITLLSGCGTGLSSGGGTAPIGSVTTHITGNVHGGQQPVSGATIQLYAVGNTSDKSAATALISSTVLTGNAGDFNITGLWNCNNTAVYGSDPLLYLVATGGNPGLSAGTTNPALALMTALGPCSGITSSTFISVNEVTTVASVYALAPFMADYAHAGAANQAALKNAFSTVQSLIDSSSGFAPGPGLVSGATAPVATLYTLADAMATCVNSNGTGACDTLFAATKPASGTAASETIGAMLQLAHAPAGNPGAIFSLVGTDLPFQPALTAAPADWTLAEKFTSGGLNAPAGIAIDASGNAWVANAGGGSVTELSSEGAPLTGANGYTGGGTIFGAQGVAVDKAGNVWLSDTLLSTVVKLTVAGGVVQQSASYSAALNGPAALAVDGQNHVWVANFGDGSVTELDNNGTPMGGSPLTVGGTLQAPAGVAIDAGGNAWVTDNGLGVVMKFDKNQNVVSGTGFSDGAMLAPQGIAIDAQGKAWVADNGNAAVTLLAADGTAAAPYTGGGLTLPAAIAMDGAGVAWVANNVAGGGLTQIVPGTSAARALGNLNAPAGVAVDASGNVWTANSGDNSVSKFVGIASAVVTPIASTVGP
jgi:sugar lactone lactonase YvrE